jgi:hypothetical protein
MLELYIHTGRAATAMHESIELSHTVFLERDGCEIVGRYAVVGDELHVAYERHTISAPLRGSNPEVLAHVLLGALLETSLSGAA